MFGAAACQDCWECTPCLQTHFKNTLESARKQNSKEQPGNWDESGLFIPALIKKDNLSCHGEGSLSLKEKSKHALERRVSHIPEHLSLDGIIIPCQENCFVTKYQPLGDRMGQKPSIRTMPRRRWYQGDYPKFTLAPEDPGKLSVCL